MASQLRQLVHSVRDKARFLWSGAPQRTVYDYDPKIDTLRSALTKKLTFSKLESILGAADDGEITDALKLFDEMEQRDGRLHAVASTRRLALTGLDWEIASAAEVRDKVSDKKLADAAAEFVRNELSEIDGWETALEHMATAIGPNLAVLEVVWLGGRVADLVPIPNRRLMMRMDKSLDVRVETDQERVDGVVATSPKFVVHIPHAKSGSPLSGALTRAQAWVWLIKKLALSDWATFVELYGMPGRLGKYGPSTTTAEKKVLKNMLENLGPNAWAMISDATQIEFVESSQRGTSPHEALWNAMSREQSILWLGGNLTSDTTGGTGTFAAATVQDSVRADLRDDDIKREARTLREQLFWPMVQYHWRRGDVPVPFFRRVRPETVDRTQEAQLFAVAQQAGIEIPEDWAYDRLGIRKPEPGEKTLVPSLDAFGEGMAEDVGGID